MAETGLGRSYRARAAAVIPGGVNSGQRSVEGLEELVLVSSSGSTVTDADGRRYIDFHAAFGPPLLGHNDPDVDRAVAQTAASLDLPGVGVTPPEIELAEALVELIPSAERVLLTVTGSEATFHAIRVARAATGRRYIIKFQGCYHGWHDAVAMNVISPSTRIDGTDPLSAGSVPEVLEQTIVLPFNDLDALETVFAERGHEIAAVITEPIPHNIGAVLPVEGFLEGIQRLCNQHSAVFILDEVITGFRHDLGGYQRIAGLRPDLTTLGKAFGNGYPISALVGRADLMDMFSSNPGSSVFFAGTFNGHPATVAAAVATLRKLREEPVHDHVYRLGERARDGMREVTGRLGLPAVVSGFGSIFVTYFLDGPVRDYRDLLRNDVDRFVGYRRRAIEHGIFELPLNLKRSHVSYAHTDGDIDRLLEVTERTLTDG